MSFFCRNYMQCTTDILTQFEPGKNGIINSLKETEQN